MVNRVGVVKDLGVWLDSKMDFKYHVERTISRSNSFLGLIRRFGREFQDPYIIKSLYYSLVLPILEYRMPFFDSGLNCLESVQKQFLLFALRDLCWSNIVFRFHLTERDCCS